MVDRRSLGQTAVAQAIRTRSKAGHELRSPLCPFDLAEQIGIEVRFVDIPSLEGMYLKRSAPLILVSADRPPGRQSYTCAHEIGHHEFQHGTHVDLVEADTEAGGVSSEEYLANVFASSLLMPRPAVIYYFKARGLSVGSCTPQQALALAGWLGVSYDALVGHLYRAIRALDRDSYERLAAARLKDIRASYVGKALANHHLVIVDEEWSGQPIDLRVGDLCLAPHLATEVGPLLEFVGQAPLGRILRALAPGRCTVATPDGRWSAIVRIMRAQFAGRSVFRHLEDPDIG